MRACRIKNRLLHCVLFASAVFVLALPVRGESLVIDDFESPSPAEVFALAGPGPVLPSEMLMQHNVSGVLGGQRDVLVEVLSGPQSISVAGLVGYDADFEVGNIQLAAFGNPGTRLSLQYDGADGAINPDTTDGLQNARAMNVDLTGGGTSTGLLLRFLSVDPAQIEGLPVSIVATSPNNTLGGQLVYEGFVPESAGGMDHVIPFADFSVEAAPGDPIPSFSQIDSLTFVFNGEGVPNVDYRLDLIKAVPEPPALIALWAGACALAFFGWCRRKR